MKHRRYMLSSVIEKDTNSITLPVQFSFWTTNIRVHVSEPELITINGIFIDDSSESELIIPTDAWIWSLKLNEKITNDFLTLHGLVGKSSDEIDTFLDISGLSIPDPSRIELPVVHKNIKITGIFRIACPIMLIGWIKS